MPNSLRVRLLAWYTLILAVVIVAFAGITGLMLWQSRIADIDAALATTATDLAGALRPAGDGDFDLELPLEYVAAGEPAASLPYYAIWSSRGVVIDRSPGAPDSMPPAVGRATRGGRRELTVEAADGAHVLVGRDLADARATLLQFAGTMAISGVLALAVALAGGWFLVGRALAPVGRINRAAAAMAAGDRSARIPVDRIDNELEQVVVALNDAFDHLNSALDRERRFTADASHELRTPIATLAAETEWALAQPRSGTEYRGSLHTCRRAIERMTRVVNRLLTLARGESRSEALRRVPIQLDSVASEVLLLLEPLASRRDIVVEAHLQPVTLQGDYDRLAELLTNLCANAVEHNRDGGRVHVTVGAQGAEAVVCIRDTGHGIDERDLPHIFEPFYRPDAARNRGTGGAGLGLAIAKWITEAHGGAIACRSRLGEGTEVVVRLPQFSVQTANEHVELP